MMLLVIDATKGIQTQTAEVQSSSPLTSILILEKGLVIGEITTDKMIVVLNKCDLFPEATRATQIEKMKAGLKKTLDTTRFANCPMVEVSANPNAGNPLAGIP